jgi:uncharacterized protein
MSPEETNLVKELFNRLHALENTPRDRAAEALIEEGLQYAPNAPYALVQTVLVQDEALKRANARIQELEGGADADAPRDTSFLGNMRDSLLGRRDSRGSVPSVSPSATSTGMSPAWRQTGTPVTPPSAPSGPWPAAPTTPTGMGSSFLGTAAAAAAGMVGGSLLLSSIRSMMGTPSSAHAAYDPSVGSPPRADRSDTGELSHQAGIDDIGRSQRSAVSDASTGDGYGMASDNQADFASDGTSDDEFDDTTDDDSDQ